MLSTDFKKEHSNIPWSLVSGLRHRLVHDYEGINWSFLQAGCIDELSLIIAPATDGLRDTATTFDRSPFMADGVPVGFTLKEAKRVQSDGVWLTYEPNNIKRKTGGNEIQKNAWHRTGIRTPVLTRSLRE